MEPEDVSITIQIEEHSMGYVATVSHIGPNDELIKICSILPTYNKNVAYCEAIKYSLEPIDHLLNNK